MHNRYVKFEACRLVSACLGSNVLGVPGMVNVRKMNNPMLEMLNTAERVTL